VDGILADLGISSHQIDLPERGFSIRFDGPLDMRMNRSANLTAKDVIHTYSEEELTRILRTYGELRNASGIARALVKEREVSEIATVQDLMKCTERWAPKGKDFRFYAQVFQAIRIEVNHELGVLQKFLQKATQLIRPEGPTCGDQLPLARRSNGKKLHAFGKC
jgi:16S rRNA (cytosine1402-N4)-methyltransferase